MTLWNNYLRERPAAQAAAAAAALIAKVAVNKTDAVTRISINIGIV